MSSQDDKFASRKRTWFLRPDVLVWTIIIVFGILTVVLRQRTSDFVGEDAFYADAAISLLHHGFYGVNGVPETTQPPGLAVILAGIYALFGSSYSVSVSAMAAFGFLGFVLSYELIRRRSSRLVAAGICFVLLTSPWYFSWATRQVYACLPYFFTTMLALFAGRKYLKKASDRVVIAWGLVFAVMVAFSLLIASGTVALVGASCAVLILSAWWDREKFQFRAMRLMPIVLLGIAVLVWWMHRKPAPLEWSLPGYPASYLEQIRLKYGNYPELGMATWSDIPVRLVRNLLDESNVLALLVFRHGCNPGKLAVIVVPVLLMMSGWITSLIRRKGSDLTDWYFGGYQFVYLLWPWKMEVRFWIPVAPLACMYIYEGGKALIAAARKRPRLFGMIWLPGAVFFTVSGLHWIYAHRVTGFGDLPDEALIPLWLVSAAYAFGMVLTDKSGLSELLPQPLVSLYRGLLGRLRLRSRELARYGMGAALFALILLGVRLEARVARENVRSTDVAHNSENTGVGSFLSSEVIAGTWIRFHTSPDSVVMARHWPTVYHYAQRKLVWFPPISDPTTLAAGILKYHISYIVVIDHGPDAYYLPDDTYCFARLFSKYPASFRLVLSSGDLRIYEIEGIPVQRTTRIASRQITSY